MANATTPVIQINEGNVGIGTSTPNAKLDIQGTQGQLFSVTDNLSGSIFAVADISGVPIFDVNSSGVSYFDGNVGIGDATPSYKLDLKKTDAAGDYAYFGASSDGGQRGLVLSSADNGAFLGAIHDFDATSGSGMLTFSTGTTERMRISSAGAIKFNTYTMTQQTGTSAYLLGVDASGNVVQSTNIPSGTGGSAGPYLPLSGGTVSGTAGTGAALVTIENTSGSTATSYGLLVKGGGNSSSGKTFEVQDSSGNSDFIVKGNGNVGIGNTGPYTKLLVGSRGTAAATSISAIDGLAFDFYNDGPPYKRHGVIISQAGDASESVLDFNTKAASGTNSTKMTILGNGNVGIGVTAPVQKLHIVDTNGANIILNSNTGAENNGIWMTEGGVATPYVNGAYVHYDSTNNIFKINTGTTSLATRFEIARDTGAIKFNAYNSTNQTGTPTYLLGTDASGNVVKTLSTPGSLPQFTNIRSAAYTSLTGSSNDWFTLFQVTDSMGPVNCKMFTYAHDSLEFSVTEGYGPSNAGSITIINSAHTSNGGFATVSAVRIDQNGYVEVQLFWSSGPTVNIGIMLTGYNAPSLPASLATSTQTATIVDSVGVDISGLLRSKRQLIIGGTSSSLVANTVKLTNIGDSYISGNSGDKFGIGTATPSEKLEVYGKISCRDKLLINGVDFDYASVESTAGHVISRVDTQDGIFDYGDQAMYINAGNVGIGTASPFGKLDVVGNIRLQSANQIYFGGTGSIPYWTAGVDNTTNNNFVIGGQSYYSGDRDILLTPANNGNVGIGTSAPGSKLNVVAPLSSGGTAVDFQTSGGSGYGMTNLNVEIPGYGTGIKINSLTSSSVDNQAMTFYQQTTKVGSIMINTSSTSYNTTSDYRLKENREDISDAIERVKELKPIKFNWIKEPGESKVDGFYAHELAEVVPEAVTGEKDALDWEGNPEYQAIDQAKIVPLLTAALQQAIDKIEALELRINKLEK